MEDFYALTYKDLPSFSRRVKKCFAVPKTGNEENPALFLLPLAIDLLKNIDKVRTLKNRIQLKYNRNRDGNGEISDGFLELVSALLEENKGTVNLRMITEVLRLNDYSVLAYELEEYFLNYSLPSSSGGDNANIYFLSSDLSRAGNTDIHSSIWNTIPVEQAFQNSVILEEVFKKLPPEDQKAFRLVSPTWTKETFSFWRKNAKIMIHVLRKGNWDNNGVLLNSFMNFLEGNGILVGKPLHTALDAKDGGTRAENDKD